MYKRIVVLTGAGISAESGLSTFRGAGGLWQGYRVEDVASPGAFARNPELVQTFYNMRRRQLLTEIEPNSAHLALAEFEKCFSREGGDFLLITQNVDDLHERGGSKQVHHLHGELLKARSTETGKVIVCKHDLTGTDYRPHIVWFGEEPFGLEMIYHRLRQCELFISIGTSGHVYPAAGFVELAKQAGAHTVEINLEPGEMASLFDEQILGAATEMVPRYFTSLLQNE